MRSIVKRQEKEKQKVIELLQKTPIVHIVCERVGIGRATYYRWRKEDLNFSTQTDEALSQGSNLINDLAESQLISRIREQDLTAIIFWLKNHHPAYGNKLELTGNIKHEYTLTIEEEQLISQALTNVIGEKGKNE